MKFSKLSQLFLVSTIGLLVATLLTACQLVTIDYLFVASSAGSGSGSAGQIQTYAVDSQTGVVRIAAPSVASGGVGPIAMAVTPDYANLYVANQGNNTDPNNAQSGIAGYTIDPASHQLTTQAGEPYGSGAGPQCLVEDPSNQFVYTANFNDSTVTGRSIDQVSGVLRSLRVASSYTLTGPATWCIVDGRTS